MVRAALVDLADAVPQGVHVLADGEALGYTELLRGEGLLEVSEIGLDEGSADTCLRGPQNEIVVWLEQSE